MHSLSNNRVLKQTVCRDKIGIRQEKLIKYLFSKVICHETLLITETHLKNTQTPTALA